MMPKGKGKRVTVYLAAAVILVCYFAQTTDCSRLKKTERREGRKETGTVKTIGVREGKIVFGRVFKKGSDSQHGIKKSSSNTSVEDEAAYQADSAGWSREDLQDPSSREASWKRMVSSLQCGGDHLKFRAVGPGASGFAVEQDNAAPVPLSQVPSACGYSMQRNSLALVMLVPYDGCNMVQEGGNYVLPMHWQGIPVSLVCPKAAVPAPTPALQQPMPQVPIPGVQNPDLQPYYFPYPYAQYPPGVMPEPTTATTTTTTKKPKMRKFPQYPFYPGPFNPYFPPPLPVTTTTTTTTAKPPTAPMVAPFPFYPPYFPWPYQGPLPATATPTTPSTTTQPQSPESPQFPPYPPFFPPYPFFPHYPQFPFFPPPIPNYPQYPTLEPQTTPTTTTTEITAPPLTPSPDVQPHRHPHGHYPFFIRYPPQG
ncbi:leucine-rich repeat extensin-like protein 5 [Morone saxatilis]|uniref:leucine-rich repeat extensin-like protein 5 n=1 Tax=Morone saxatilis TaxID=34816 RepID=UPI0015E2043F|nr:leucine-rich repeat extensin-like protein 5 [Morone saxatilis]